MNEFKALQEALNDAFFINQFNGFNEFIPHGYSIYDLFISEEFHRLNPE